MKSTIFAAIAVLCILFSVHAQEQTQKQMADDPMMKAWEAYATPGEVHKNLAALAGTWDADVTSYYMDPKTPSKSKGVSTFSVIMDGRYVHETVEGTFDGMPFHGMGIYGYDNALKHYVSTWVDNMGTGVMIGEGTSPDNGKTINWTSTAVDPMSGKEQSYRSAMHKMSDDQYHFEMWGPGMDGKEMKMMEITYNR
ncbi:MAG TPA: DUF1579 domain-containing protein, partial [Acidobacteriota bacterium]|nr:DUF1579 domain-containing protein [Acidobacteriota bacterium]